MGIVQDLLRDIPLPKMVRIEQHFDSAHLPDPLLVLRQELEKDSIQGAVKSGMAIAVAVGSRGVDRIDEITAEVVAFLKRLGAKPFIVPAMASHGGATAEGQKAVLRHLGITEETMQAEIRSSMEVTRIGTLANGLPVYVDQYAASADGIVPINRVKPHTAFRGTVESGLMKMLAIGLGKQKGAEAVHQMGFKYMAENVPAAARVIMDTLPVLFGVATVENAFDRVADIRALLAEDIFMVEPSLLEKAKSLMPRLYFDNLDVLVIDEIGKNISGDGMDPNITGRYPTPYAQGGPEINKMVVLDVTDASEGNANGVGTSDYTTRRLVEKMDREKTYANGLTSTVVAPTKIATYLESDREAIQAAIKTANILDLRQVRLVRIKNTLSLKEIEVSETLLPEVQKHEMLRVLSEPYELLFDEQGNLNLRG